VKLISKKYNLSKWQGQPLMGIDLLCCWPFIRLMLKYFLQQFLARARYMFRHPKFASSYRVEQFFISFTYSRLAYLNKSITIKWIVACQ